MTLGVLTKIVFFLMSVPDIKFYMQGGVHRWRQTCQKFQDD